MADLPINSNDAQPTNIVDGASNTTLATVKAASTASAATDTSLVIAHSPNSPLPAGTNVIGHVITDSGSVASASQSGTWTVQPGNTANTTPWLITLNQGGNSATVTASNALKVDGSAVTQPVSGTVTSNIGTTNGLALDATVAKLTLAQASTTSGQTGPLIQGAVTTASPAYTTAQTSPLSLLTTGALRIDNTSWLGSTAPTVGQKTMANSVPVVIASDNGIIVAQGSTTSGQSGHLIQGAVTTAAPAYTTAQTSPLSLDTNGSLRVIIPPKATYSAAITALVMAATPTDVFTITGSATKTIKVTRIRVSGTQTTGGTTDALLIRRSAANTLGTSTTPTVVQYDTNDAAGTAVVRAYTANPTTGATVGTLASYSMFIPAPAPGGNNPPFILPELYEAIRPAEAITLRGIAQVLAVNFNSVTVTGNTMDIFIEWTEE